MADPSSTERLQPSLLDRLTDDAPTVLTEPREARVLTKGQLRTAVLRDLAALMNAICLGAGDDLSAYPEVERSVLNYGMPAFAGETASTLDVHDLEEGIRGAILRFEPRVLPNTLLVEAMATELAAHRVGSGGDGAGQFLNPAAVQWPCGGRTSGAGVAPGGAGAAAR